MKTWHLISVGLIIGVVVILTLLLTPQQTNPAFAAATNFMNAVGSSDDVIRGGGHG